MSKIVIKLKFVLIFLLSVIFNGCSSDSNNSGSNSDVIKYEITSTSPFQVINSGTSALPSITVGYTNETGQQQQDQLLVGGTTWTKTVNLTTPQRPIQVVLSASGYTQSSNGTVTLKVYVNNVLRGTQNLSISPNPIPNYGIFIGGNISGILIQ